MPLPQPSDRRREDDLSRVHRVSVVVGPDRIRRITSQVQTAVGKKWLYRPAKAGNPERGSNRTAVLSGATPDDDPVVIEKRLNEQRVVG